MKTKPPHLTMKKNIFLHLAALGLCIVAFYSCGKDSPTIVHGTVVDKYTGKPIEGVSITLQITHKGDPSNNTGIKDIVSDGNGNFYFEYNVPVYLFELRKSGYLRKGGSTNFIFVKQGEVNNLTVEMIPKDGKLSLILDNIKPQFDTIFVGVYSPILDSETTFSNGIVSSEAYIIPFGAAHIKDIDLASNESVIIYWSFSPVTSSFNLAPNKDTVFISSNQTALHNIAF